MRHPTPPPQKDVHTAPEPLSVLEDTIVQDSSPTPARLCRILSIQSHVVSGNVGNRAAAFALQLLRHPVDVINTVQFTSLTVHEGHCMAPETLETLLRTLPAVTDAKRSSGSSGAPNAAAGPGRIHHQFLLTGYMGCESLLQSVIHFVTEQRQVFQAEFLWVCDPVLGDNGKLYVPPGLLATYRDQALPHIDVLTPNQDEFQWLIGEGTVTTMAEVVTGCRALHAKGPRVIIVTSLSLPGDSRLKLVVSERLPKPDGATNTTLNSKLTVFLFDRRDAYLGGTGDLMAAMIVHGLHRFGGDSVRACALALAVLQGVIDWTLTHHPDMLDIACVDAAHEILNPSRNYDGVVWESGKEGGSEAGV